MGKKKIIKENNKNETKTEKTLGNIMVMQVLVTIALIIICIIYASNEQSGFMGGFSEGDMTLIYFMFIGSSVLSSIFIISGYLQKERKNSLIGTIIFAFFPLLIIFSELPNITINHKTIISIILAIYCIITLIAELRIQKNKKR